MIESRTVYCAGVAEDYGVNTNSELRYWELTAEPVQAVVTRDKSGVITVDCAFYGSKVCARPETVPYDTSRRSKGITVCRYLPAAEYISKNIYKSAFETKSFYERQWKQLSNPAQVACTRIQNIYRIEGISKQLIGATCHIYDLPDAEKILDELAEHGVIEEMSQLEILQTIVKEMEDGHIEGVTITNTKFWEKKKKEVQQKIEEYYEYLEQHKDNTEIVSCAKKNWETPQSYVRFSPGFYAYIDQMYDEVGIPVVK